MISLCVKRVDVSSCAAATARGRMDRAESAGARGGMQGILVSGKPHLGTDRLVLLLRAFRRRLAELGVDLRFGAAMADLLVQRGRVCGVRLRGAHPPPALRAGGP